MYKPSISGHHSVLCCQLTIVFWSMLVVQVVVRKNPDATTDEERSRLETVGRFHTGVFINRICQGSLVSSKEC